MSSSADFPAVDQLALPEDLQSRLQIAQEHGLVLPSGMVADTSYSGFIEYNRWVYPPRKWQRRDWTLRWNEYYPSGGGALSRC
ncbi:hypothetical protein [Tsukamurella spumae]|uniref:hypothetical protein n=1 Tax=Tsukamurella spumae TaxID=44753 RepID=UPI0031D6D0D1